MGFIELLGKTDVAANRGPRLQAFHDYYAPRAKQSGISPDPFAKEHHYDYPAAWKSYETTGIDPYDPKSKHWSAKFKRIGHPSFYTKYWEEGYPEESFYPQITTIETRGPEWRQVIGDKHLKEKAYGPAQIRLPAYQEVVNKTPELRKYSYETIKKDKYLYRIFAERYANIIWKDYLTPETRTPYHLMQAWRGPSYYRSIGYDINKASPREKPIYEERKGRWEKLYPTPKQLEINFGE